MGQYLMIGLTTQVVINKKEANQCKITAEEVIHLLKEKKRICPDLYLRQEDEDEVVLTLEPTLFQSGLLPFLKDFYQDFYFSNDAKCDAEEVLSDLSKESPDQWMTIADQKEYECYQTSGYMETDYLRVNSFHSMRIRQSHIILSMNGKISMECYGDLFCFLKKCIRERFAEHPLSQTIDIYIG